MDMEKLVQVSDQEVRICFELNAKCRATVNLCSLIYGVPVVFKVQTSSPNKFLVNPPSGFIAPHLTTASFQIILKPQPQIPSTFPRSPSDRFLIRAMRALEFASYSANEVTSSVVTSWFLSRPHHPTHDVKLKVAFIGPLLLREAVAANRIDSAKSLLRRQRAIASEISVMEAESILKIAIESSNDRMIRLLVESGFRIRATVSGTIEKPKYKPLDRAEIQCGSSSVQNEELGEALLESARVGDVNKLKWLIQNVTELTFSDQYGLTALHIAAIKGRSDTVTLLLECGCGKDWRDAEGHTPLHLAVEGGNVETVEILVRGGADINAVSDRGATPLHIAQALGYVDIAQLLADIGTYP